MIDEAKLLKAVQLIRETEMKDSALLLMCDGIEELLVQHARDELRLKERDRLLEERAADIEQMVGEVARKERMLEELAGRIYEWQVRLNTFSQALGNIYKTSEAGRGSEPSRIGQQLIPMFTREKPPPTPAPGAGRPRKDI